MRAILLLTLLLTALGACSQTQPSLPSGTVPYSTNLYRATDGSIWTGKTGSYTNLGNKQYVDSLASIGYTNEMIDSIALYNYDRARNRANHTGTQAQSTVVNLVSDLASKENISNKVTSLSSPNDTTYPTTQAVANALSTNTVEWTNVLNRPQIMPGSLNSSNFSGMIGVPSNATIHNGSSDQSGYIYGSGGNLWIRKSQDLLNRITIGGVNTGVSISAGNQGSWSTGGVLRFLNIDKDSVVFKKQTYPNDLSNAEFQEVKAGRATSVNGLVTLGQLNDSLSTVGGGGSQNLQQVTTEGNSTTNGIVINPGSLITPSLPNGTSISANNQFFRIERAKGTNTGNTDSEIELSNSYARLTSYDTGHSYTTNLVLNGNDHVIELTTEISDGNPEEPQAITTGFIIDGINEVIQATHPITGVAATQPDHLVTKAQLDANSGGRKEWRGASVFDPDDPVEQYRYIETDDIYIRVTFRNLSDGALDVAIKSKSYSGDISYTYGQSGHWLTQSTEDEIVASYFSAPTGGTVNTTTWTTLTIPLVIQDRQKYLSPIYIQFADPMEPMAEVFNYIITTIFTSEVLSIIAEKIDVPNTGVYTTDPS